jgi:levansucrase
VSGIQTALWTRAHLDRLTATVATTAPQIGSRIVPRVLADDDVWDLWPVQDPDGSTVTARGQELWMTLSAPAQGHPESRHDVARLRLIGRQGDVWSDLGPVFGDGASPGSREWSGSAVRRPDGSVSVFYTAAGRRGEARRTYLQRVLEAQGRLVVDSRGVRLETLGPHREIVRPDGRTYLHADEIDGAPGRIRAFRDPAWFRDPADGRAHLLVAASVPRADGFTGAIAHAVEDGGGWSLGPPLLRADGVNHELERPHIVRSGSRYYLFFSTQRGAFHPSGSAPTGLYGFVAPGLPGPWEPLNGSGLVSRNPPGAPDQAYAWLVLPDLRAVGFLNYRSDDGTDPRFADAEAARAGFGGTAAPELRLRLEGASTSLVAA